MVISKLSRLNQTSQTWCIQFGNSMVSNLRLAFSAVKDVLKPGTHFYFFNLGSGYP